MYDETPESNFRKIFYVGLVLSVLGFIFLFLSLLSQATLEQLKLPFIIIGITATGSGVLALIVYFSVDYSVRKKRQESEDGGDHLLKISFHPTEGTLNRGLDDEEEKVLNELTEIRNSRYINQILSLIQRLDKIPSLYLKSLETLKYLANHHPNHEINSFASKILNQERYIIKKNNNRS